MLDNVALKDLLGKGVTSSAWREAAGYLQTAGEIRAPMIEATRRGMNANFGLAGQLAGVRVNPGGRGGHAQHHSGPGVCDPRPGRRN
jgi:hypothetical protein